MLIGCTLDFFKYCNVSVRLSSRRSLKLLQRALLHKKKGSNNRHRLNRKIARLHQRIADTRKDWQFKLAHKLCDDAGMMFVEDIDFRTWAKGMLGKHTLDAGFGQFIEILKWVCWKRGVYFDKVNKDYTSQVCPQCNTYTGKKELKDRVHSCQSCGYITHRDVAAAQVIRNRGETALCRRVSRPRRLRTRRGSLGSCRSLEENACGDGLTGTGNSLVKSRKSSEVAVERHLLRVPPNICLRIPAHLCRGVRQPDISVSPTTRKIPQSPCETAHFSTPLR
jgi:putative transposase